MYYKEADSPGHKGVNRCSFTHLNTYFKKYASYRNVLGIFFLKETTIHRIKAIMRFLYLWENNFEKEAFCI